MQRDLSMLVCGFGTHLEGLVQYLDRGVALIKAHRPANVLFSGGPTQQKTTPGLTEAQVMRDYVVPRCSELTGTVWLCDHNAFDSIENVRNAKDILEARTSPGRLVPYTDASRALKVRYAAKRLMPDWKTTVETYDMHSSPEGQVAALMLELPMLYVPALHVPWSLYRRGWRAKRI